MAFQTLTYQMNVLASFAPDRFIEKKVADNPHVEINVLCLDTGQFLPEHQADSDMLMVVWEGRADVLMGDKEQQVSTGFVVSIRSGQRRAIRARTKFIALVIYSPPPSQGAREMIYKLTKLQP